MPDDIASGCVQYLSRFADVTSLLGSFSLTDPVTANQGRPWIFSADPLVTLEGTSSAAIVCSDFGGWMPPPQLGTWRFGRLSVQLYVDAARDGNRNITETSAITVNRGNALFAAVQFRLQRTDPDTVAWGDLVTTGCQLLTDGPWLPVPDGDHLLVKQAFYGVSWSGWTDAAELARPVPGVHLVPAGEQLLHVRAGGRRGALEVAPGRVGGLLRVPHPADVQRDEPVRDVAHPGQHPGQRREVERAADVVGDAAEVAIDAGPGVDQGDQREHRDGG